ncbi:MAG TPA: DNA-formamidopyrimidine glycosylase family protein [Acidimicrobiales bacterium]|nr:DNA-formamidopyrimidine glycosylase family protein [Acidimicrobiales bacterium]
MPELPEIQAHAERLHRDFAGARLERFVPLAFTALKTATPPADSTHGHEVVFVGRRGKYLLIDVGVATFVIHLMQGGRLKLDDKQAAKPRFGQARWLFADGRALLLTEAGTERKAGVWVVADDPERQPPLVDLGPDADQLDADALGALLAAHPMRLHGFLRDQRILAGLGRRLANEVCHRALLSPFANTAKLDRDDTKRLVEAIAVCINEGLAYERGLDEMSSSADRPGHVHHRVGEPCPACGDTIRSVEYARYTVAYCPTCQTNGKILADNTTSKFLK